MNISKLKRNLLSRVRLRPVVLSTAQSGESVPVDDAWLLAAVNDNGVLELHNIATGHIAKLGHDHVHHYDSDPLSQTDGLNHGFISLHVQVVLRGGAVQIEPLSLSERRINR